MKWMDFLALAGLNGIEAGLSVLMSSQQLLTLPPTFNLSNMSSKTANTPGVCLSFS